MFGRRYPEGVGGAQVELLPDFLGRSGAQTIEDVVVSLLRTLRADPRLLQQVMRHKAAHHGVLPGDGNGGSAKAANQLRPDHMTPLIHNIPSR